METGPVLLVHFARAFKAGTSIKFSKNSFWSDMWEISWKLL